MDRLPAEVFNEVLDHLEPRGRESPAEASRRNPWAQPQPHKPDHIDSRQHYSRLRLVCKRFDELATPYLFRSIGLRFNLKSFGRLEKLAARPGLSRHVRKFVYLMPYLYEEGTQNFDAFRNDQTLGLSNKIRQIMFEDKAPYYYTSVHNEQQDLMRDSYDLNVLRTAMKAFTSLQEVQLLAIMVHKDIVLRNLASSFDNWEFIDCKWIPACKHAVETMLRALYDANSPVTALCSPTMSPQSLVLLGPKTRQISRRTWSQLTCLEITFDERPDRSYLDTSGTVLTGHSETMADMFRNLLHMAQNLSTLYIRFTPGMPVRLPLKDAFNHDVRWPKLRVLGIGSWMLRADELVDIVRRHGRTLTGFRLSEVYLLDGDRWRDVMVAVKEAAPRLEWVGLHDVSYEQEYAKKQAYIETYSDTSSEYDDDQYGPDLDGLSMRSRDSTSSTTASHDLSLPLHLAQAGDGDDGDGDDDDVVYGNVFTTASTSPTLGGGGTSSIHGGSVFEVGELEDGLGEDLEDDGRTVTQAQRRHWERWVVGRYASGEVYTRAL